MNVEHFGFLSSVFRKAESHEQDGETLRGAPWVRNNTASGDPAMALRASIRLARTDTPSGSIGGFSKKPPRNRGHEPAHSARGHKPRATILNGEC
jgi:hypothetical protein